DRAEGDRSVFGRLARRDAELRRERIDDALCAGERARQVRAHLDEVRTDWLEVIHVVERRDRLAIRGRHVERLGCFAERVGREPAVLVLREAEGLERRAARSLGVLRALGLDRVVEAAHRSTSPMTVSSDPTIAI